MRHGFAVIIGGGYFIHVHKYVQNFALPVKERVRHGDVEGIDRRALRVLSGAVAEIGRAAKPGKDLRRGGIDRGGGLGRRRVFAADAALSAACAKLLQNAFHGGQHTVRRTGGPADRIHALQPLLFQNGLTDALQRLPEIFGFVPVAVFGVEFRDLPIPNGDGDDDVIVVAGGQILINAVGIVCRQRAGKAQKPGGGQRQQRPSAFLGKKTVLLHAKDLLCPLDISCLNIV